MLGQADIVPLGTRKLGQIRPLWTQALGHKLPFRVALSGTPRPLQGQLNLSQHTTRFRGMLLLSERHFTNLPEMLITTEKDHAVSSELAVLHEDRWHPLCMHAACSHVCFGVHCAASLMGHQ